MFIFFQIKECTIGYQQDNFSYVAMEHQTCNPYLSHPWHILVKVEDLGSVLDEQLVPCVNLGRLEPKESIDVSKCFQSVKGKKESEIKDTYFTKILF